MIRDTDKGYKNLLKIMKSAKISADIGIFQGEVDDDGESVADYAIKNEYGDGKTPARPFTSRAFDMNEREAYELISKDIKENLLKNNYNLKKSVGRGAEFMVGKIVESIKSARGWASVLSDATIARKKSDIPLIEKGIMWKAVHYRYVNMVK